MSALDFALQVGSLQELRSQLQTAPVAIGDELLPILVPLSQDYRWYFSLVRSWYDLNSPGVFQYSARDCPMTSPGV